MHKGDIWEFRKVILVVNKSLYFNLFAFLTVRYWVEMVGTNLDCIHYVIRKHNLTFFT